MTASEDRYVVGDSPPSSPRPVADVVESAVQLARAEGALVLARTKTIGVRAVATGILAFATLSLAQVSLMLLALSGVISRFSSPGDVLLGLAPALVLTLVCGVLAFVSFKRLDSKDSSPGKEQHRAE
jgi:hypothetical protein